MEFKVSNVYYAISKNGLDNVCENLDVVMSKSKTVTVPEYIETPEVPAEAGTRVVTKVGYGYTVDERQFTCAQGDTTFTITGEQAAQNKFHVYLNGMLLKRGEDYTAGSPVVLSTAAKEGDEVCIMNANAEEFFTASLDQTKFTATDTSTTATNTQVYLNGVFQEVGTDYTLGNPSVTIINPVTGLTAGDHLDIVITR